MAGIAEVIEYKTVGSEIFAAGDAANFLYLVATGVVEGARTLASGDKHIVAFYWPGDLMGLAEDGLYLNSAKALAPCTVFRFPIAKLRAFLLEHPLIQQHFLVKAVHDLRNAQRQLIMMGRFNIPTRLAAFLLDCASHDRYFDQGAATLTLPVTRYDIADYIGTSAEVVTRAFGQLELGGALQRRSPRVMTIDVARLEGLVNANRLHSA